jgi:hypothetical protein
MESITLRSPEKHFLSKQALPPEGNESGTIECRRMYGPQSHRSDS